MPVRISVVLPVYNVEKYLEKCLDSLANQTFTDFEVICVNDGSTDSSLAILNEYAIKDSRFKIITQKNRGLSGARNTGIKHVTGEYTLFVDSDDWLEHDALNELYCHVEKFQSDISMFKFKYYYEDSGKFEESPFTDLNIIPESLNETNFSYRDVLNILFKISHAPFNKLYKTSFLKGVCDFPENLIYEDLYFFYTVFLKAETSSVLRKSLYYYRIRDNSISTTGDEKSFDIFEVLCHVQSVLMDENIYDDVCSEFFLFIIVTLKYVYQRLKVELKDEFIGLMKRYYDYFNLCDVNSFEGWHYQDQSFYKSISVSTSYEIFDLNFEKFQYEFLTNHYKTLAENLQAENDKLKSKNRLRRIVGL